MPSPDVAMDALDRIDAIGRQAHADMQTAVTAAETATTAAENAKKSATAAGVSADTAEQAASRAETAKTSAETSATQAETARQGAETAISAVKLTDKELKRRVDALYSIGQGVTHRFETDTDTAYAKTVPTGGKLMSVKSIGGHSEVIDGEIVSAGVTEVVEQGRNLFDVEKCAALGLYYGFEIDTNKTLQIALKDGKTCPTNVSFGIVYVHGNTMANWLITSNGVRETITNSRDMTDSTQIMVACYPGNKETMQSIADAFDIMLVDGIYKSDTMPAYAPYHSNVYPIPETIRALPGYGWSAGTARNYVDYENKRYVQCVSSVDLGTLAWSYRPEQQRFYAIADSITGKFSESFGIVPNIVVAKYDIVCFNDITTKTDNMKASAVKTANDYITIRNTAYTDATAFKQAMQGVMLYYELETPIVTDISDLIPDDFLRNVEVEAGGSITFRSSNDSYRIPVPNEEEYIVKLSEVGDTT